jgi:hypothetical protein
MFGNDYITMAQLRRRLGLPMKYLQGLADRGILPTLLVNGKRRVTENNARDVLDEIAATPGKQTILKGDRR